MARRDNAPYKNQTKRKLPNNIEELISKAKGSPREAWRKSVERLEKRIEKAERETGERFDVASELPREEAEYILYGKMPKRVKREWIYNVEKIRIKDVKNIIQEKYKYDEYEPDDSYDEETDFHISYKEIETLRLLIDDFDTFYFRNKFNNALDAAIEAYGPENVAYNISAKMQELKTDITYAQKYESTEPDKSERFAQEFNLILMNTSLTVEENKIATAVVERTNGVKLE